MIELSGWGRHPRVWAEEVKSESLERITEAASLSRGLGRSYGDSSLPAREGATVANSTAADRLISFDESTGLVRAEAGFPLFELVRHFLPRGWFTPVTPGTQFVTVGGMVASDVHGKNHHVEGCFGEHVTALKMRLADGRIVEVTDESDPDLFRATLGGMGLTGHILEVSFRLQRVPSPWIYGESEQVPNFETLIERLREASHDWPYTVSWVDSVRTHGDVGRGILMKGRWAEPHEAPSHAPEIRRSVAVPFDFPRWALAPWSMRLFNYAYFHKHGAGVHRGIEHPQDFFYPLDFVRQWNRVYGPDGFVQYQAVVPVAQDPGVARRFFDVLTRAEVGSFLTVVKDCGPEGRGTLSFPRPGISIACDIPMRGDATQRLVDALNAVVVSAGGRIYLTKDSLTRREDYERMDPRLERFREVRRKWDPEMRIKSAQSVRVFGDSAE